MVGYRGFTIKGIEKLLEIEQLKIPLIKSKDELKQFISDTPMLTRNIALIVESKAILDGNHAEKDDVYAIVYEKHEACDKLFIYNSNVSKLPCSRPILEILSPYFRSNFLLLYPDAPHHTESFVRDEAENLSSIKDISILSKLPKQLDLPTKQVSIFDYFSLFSTSPAEFENKAKMEVFSLSEDFSYDEKEIRHDYLCKLLRINEAGLLFSEDSPSPSIS